MESLVIIYLKDMDWSSFGKVNSFLHCESNYDDGSGFNNCSGFGHGSNSCYGNSFVDFSGDSTTDCKGYGEGDGNGSGAGNLDCSGLGYGQNEWEDE